jgi:hypothetical protein
VIPKKLLSLLTVGMAIGLGHPMVQNAFADPTQEILRVTSDASNCRGFTYRLELQLSGGKFDRLIYHTFDDQTQLPKQELYTIDDLSRGIDIVVRDSHKVVRLYGVNMNEERGGQIYLDYLVNGATGNRKKMYLFVYPKRDGSWIVDQSGVEVNHLFFKTNTINLGWFGGKKEVGISRIEILR